MSNALLSSKTVIEEEAPQVRAIQGVQTSIVAAVGIAERGPIASPTLVTSWDGYVETFGGYIATDPDLPLAVAGFFDCGGQYLYVVRTVHYTDVTNAATKISQAGTLTLKTAAGAQSAGYVLGTQVEPFALVAADTLQIAVDGAGAVTATFNATAGAIECATAGPYALADADTLTVEVDGGAVQTISFLTAEFVNIAAATAAEVAAVINAKITGASAAASSGGTKVTITSDSEGTSSGIQVTGGTANTALGFVTTLNSGTGNVADIGAVTAAEVKTVVEAAVTTATVSSVSGAVQITSKTTGASSSVEVLAASTADTALGIDNATHSGSDGAAVDTLTVTGKTDGAYANALTIEIDAATSGESDRFNLLVLESGVTLETFANLSMIETDTNYAETIINATSGGSNLIAVTDLLANAAVPIPATGTFGPLTGGDDGLTGLVDADFVGDPSGATGIRALDTVQDANILIVPGKATSAIQNAMITYCEVTRNLSMFAVLDPPAGYSATEIITYFETTAGLLGLSEFGAAYWPRVKVMNPSTAIFGNSDLITEAPSGRIAGIYARTDGSRPGGIYIAPAGIENGILTDVLGFETDEVFDENKRDLVYPKRINILTKENGIRNIDGSRCLKGDGNFPFVAQRRGAIYLEQSIKTGIAFARQENNTQGLRRVVTRSIRAFLLGEMKVNAFASTDPDKAFFIDFSDKLNPASEENAGRMNGRVGFAFNTPAEWVIIRFSRDTRALQAELG